MSYRLCLSAGCQVCGREEKTAAGLPSHGDEQTDPNTARVHSSPDQRDPAVFAAFLSVSAHADMFHRASVCVCVCACPRASVCVCVRETERRVKEEKQGEAQAPTVSVKDVMKSVLLTEYSMLFFPLKLKYSTPKKKIPSYTRTSLKVN